MRCNKLRHRQAECQNFGTLFFGRGFSARNPRLEQFRVHSTVRDAIDMPDFIFEGVPQEKDNSHGMD